MYTWPNGEDHPRRCNENIWMFGGDCFAPELPVRFFKTASSKPWKELCSHPPPRKSIPHPRGSYVDENLFYTKVDRPTKNIFKGPSKSSQSQSQSASSSQTKYATTSSRQ